jgi:hypothetical protein
MSASRAGELCLQCSFCCDGTLFGRVPLAATDVLPAGGLGVGPEGAPHALAQPCGVLSGGACRSYATRPLACRRYDCLLVRAMVEGEVSFDGARDIVAQTRAAREALAAQVPEGEGSVLQRLRRAAAAGTLSPTAQADFERLEQRLRFHFTGQIRGA